MELKQKWRRFWTLNRHHEDGFTLVELVVVIAILAILAGVTVPAYDDYITKAKESADFALLSAVNTAFSAACVENGLDSADIRDASVKVDEGSVDGLTYVVHNTLPIDSTTDGKIKSSFDFYMAGNEETKFSAENVNTLKWDNVKKSFSILSLALRYGNATLDADALAAIMGSNFANMGADEIINMLDSNIGTFKKILDAIGNPAISFILKQFGISDATTANLTRSLSDSGALANVISKEKREEIAAGLAKKSGTEYEKAANEYSNAMVLLAAQKLTAEGTSAAGFTNQLKKSDDPSKALKVLVGSEGMANQMVNTAVDTAMKESFAETDAYKTAKTEYDNNKRWSDPPFEKTDAYDSLFDSYLIGDQGAKDMEALVGAMTLVNDNKNAVGEEELLANGVKDQNVRDLLNIAIPTT